MTDLNIVVPRYFEHKTEMDFYKKQCDAENAEIKQAMREQSIKDFEVDGIVAKYVVQNKETMNEEALLKVLKDAGYTDLIKTKEYVDMDALESALYHSEIDTDTIVAMDKCRECKEVIQLRVSKKKEVKKDVD